MSDAAASRSGQKDLRRAEKSARGEEIYSPLYPGSELGRVPGSGLGLQDAADQLRLRPDGVEPPLKNFNFDALSLIERWKEEGKAPGQLIVSHCQDGMEVGKRLVCQFPQIAVYNGGGNQEDPTSYTCK